MRLIERGAEVENSVVMAGAEICKGAVVKNAVIGPGAFVGKDMKIEGTKKDIALYTKKERTEPSTKSPPALTAPM